MHCGGTLEATTTDKSFHSPGWPTREYPDDMFCVWNITARPGYRVRVNITFFRTEFCCDFIEVSSLLLAAMKARHIMQEFPFLKKFHRVLRLKVKTIFFRNFDERSWGIQIIVSKAYLFFSCFVLESNMQQLLLHSCYKQFFRNLFFFLYSCLQLILEQGFSTGVNILLRGRFDLPWVNISRKKFKLISSINRLC